MDPFEFCSLVRESYPDIFAFLAVSEVDLPMAVARLPGSSFDELILCPFSADELLARGELLMNRHVRARTPRAVQARLW
jgi:DNA-binding response OmpR family regulator